jgi:predicted enzyme related to lactoylglutathione lyase
MERITGIGGIFFKASDPKALAQWYATHLGVEVHPAYGGAELKWSDANGSTVWALFAADTTHFEPSKKSFMVNYRVRDLDKMLAQLRAAGVAVDEKTDDTPQGKFGWAMDPDGNRFELWEPKP